MEQRKLGGYFVQLFSSNRPRPPTTVGIIIGNADGKPGHNQYLTINIGASAHPTTTSPDAPEQIGPDYWRLIGRDDDAD